MNSNSEEVFTPEKLLPPGIDSNISVNPYTRESGPTRKGIIAATLNNVVLLNRLISEPASKENQQKIQNLVEAITPLLPSLRVVGVFDFFSPEEWMGSEEQPGRTLIAVLYLQKYPENITPEVNERLKQLKGRTKKVLSEEIGKIL